VLVESAGISGTGMVLVDDRFVYAVGSDPSVEAEQWPQPVDTFFIAALPK
jgi:hypothetical protein